MKPPGESPLESEISDFAEVIHCGENGGDPPVIVGGYAVGLWSRYYLAMGDHELSKFLPFRSILFLVDRSALGELAANSFKDTRMENLNTFADVFGIKEIDEQKPDSETAVHIATIQGMVQRVLYPSEGNPPPAVDQYDCIIVDECHRGYLLDRELSETELTFRSFEDYVSKYRRVLDYFWGLFGVRCFIATKSLKCCDDTPDPKRLTLKDSTGRIRKTGKTWRISKKCCDEAPDPKRDNGAQGDEEYVGEVVFAGALDPWIFHLSENKDDGWKRCGICFFRCLRCGHPRIVGM